MILKWPIPLIFNVHNVLRNGRFSKKWTLQQWPIPLNWQEESAASKSPLLAVYAVYIFFIQVEVRKPKISVNSCINYRILNSMCSSILNILQLLWKHSRLISKLLENIMFLWLSWSGYFCKYFSVKSISLFFVLHLLKIDWNWYKSIHLLSYSFVKCQLVF